LEVGVYAFSGGDYVAYCGWLHVCVLVWGLISLRCGGFFLSPRACTPPGGCAVVVIVILPFLACFRFWGLFLGVLVVVDGGGWWGLVCGFVCFSSWGGACDGCGVVFLWLVDGALALLGPAV
jgi:hypothetical protein